MILQFYHYLFKNTLPLTASYSSQTIFISREFPLSYDEDVLKLAFYIFMKHLNETVTITSYNSACFVKNASYTA